MSSQLPTSPISGNVLFNKSAMLDADYRTDTGFSSSMTKRVCVAASPNQGKGPVNWKGFWVDKPSGQPMVIVQGF